MPSPTPRNTPSSVERCIRNRTQYLVRRADSRFHPSVARNERPLRNRVTIFVHEMGPVVYRVRTASKVPELYF